jgi:molybdenum cofactor biosynthesis enzyme MoaA
MQERTIIRTIMVIPMTSLVIDLNGTCNIACEPCYQTLDGSVLPRNIALKRVDDNPESDTVELGGGEPFLYKGFPSLVKDLRLRGKKVHVSTNATFIPTGFLELEDVIRNETQVQVSIFAASRRLYEQITGKDMIEKVARNIERIRPRYVTSLSSSIYKKNLDDVPNIVSFASAHQLPLRINLVFPTGNGRNVELLSAKEIDALRGYLLQHKILHGSIDSPLIHDNNCTALRNAYGIEKRGLCPADCYKKYVSPRNTEHSCEFLETKL